MAGKPRADLCDARVDTKVILACLWVAMLFVFAYVDIFGFWRKDVIEGALSKEVPGSGFAIDQTFLALTTVYILIPSLMVAASVLLPARVNRVANVSAGLIYMLTVAVSMAGETWVYYLLGSAVEIVLLASITWVAWKWPRPAMHAGQPGVVKAQSMVVLVD